MKNHSCFQASSIIFRADRFPDCMEVPGSSHVRPRMHHYPTCSSPDQPLPKTIPAHAHVISLPPSLTLIQPRVLSSGAQVLLLSYFAGTAQTDLGVLETIGWVHEWSSSRLPAHFIQLDNECVPFLAGYFQGLDGHHVCSCRFP